MIVKNIVDEDFVNYKKPSMFIICPYCTFKCDKENGSNVCQNSSIAQDPNIEISIQSILKRYFDNPISKSIVLGGLEPMDSFEDILQLIVAFRRHSDDDDVVIYTGYTEKEVEWKVNILSKFKNIIIKFGRFIPNEEPHYDELLGIKLASNNQYSKLISKCE